MCIRSTITHVSNRFASTPFSQFLGTCVSWPRHFAPNSMSMRMASSHSYIAASLAIHSFSAADARRLPSRYSMRCCTSTSSTISNEQTMHSQQTSFNQIPSAILSETASYLTLSEQTHLMRCNRHIYISCSAPSTFRDLSTFDWQKYVNTLGPSFVSHQGFKFQSQFRLASDLQLDPYMLGVLLDPATQHARLRSLQCLRIPVQSIGSLTRARHSDFIDHILH